MKNNTRGLVRSAIIAALYTVLTMISAAFGLSSGAVQIRISEALCILPCFSRFAAAGLAAGCFLSNMLTGGDPFDMVFGSLATFIAALLTRRFRDRKILAIAPPILVNTAVIPFILTRVYGAEAAYPVLAASVFAGELISCGLLGGLLHKKISADERLKEMISD